MKSQKTLQNSEMKAVVLRTKIIASSKVFIDFTIKLLEDSNSNIDFLKRKENLHEYFNLDIMN